MPWSFMRSAPSATVRRVARRRPETLLYALALAAGVAPLWVGRHLPMVDLPQHLHLVAVLRHLDDPGTLYPAFFVRNTSFTPYLGCYEAVRLLAALFPLEAADRLFLSAYVVAVPLSGAFLLWSLKRPAWPSLLALPFAYGDSFAWGFVNACAAWPLALFGAGACLRALAEPSARRWPVMLGACLVAALLFHVAGFAFLLLAVPLLVVLDPARGRKSAEVSARVLGGRRGVLWALVPGTLVFLGWGLTRLAAPSEIVPGAPWRAWGPLLSARNLVFKGFAQNAAELPSVLANELRDGSDRWPACAAAAVALAALAASALDRSRQGERDERGASAPLALAVLALLCFFALPFDVRGQVYYLNTRFAQPAAILLACSVRTVAGRQERAFLGAGVAVALVLGAVMGRGFAAYDLEAGALDALVPATLPRPRVMGLVFDPSARSVTHPVFLHAAAELARARGGICNFSFASTPQAPVHYRVSPPPTFPSEWRPGEFRYEVEGRYYDHFLLRGRDPHSVFGARLGTELEIVGHEGAFWLVRRR